MTAIRIENLTKTYGDATALRGVDLTVRSGELHCLLGPNGSGKSTLFAVVLGLTRPTSGTVDAPAGRPGCSFQEPSFYADLTVDENLRLFADLSGGDPSWVETVRSELGLDPVRSRIAADLSGGYQRLLDVALAFVPRRQVVLLDEPLDELDDSARGRLLGFVESYCADGNSVLASTHHLDAFEPVADRLTVLDDGDVAFDGPTEEFESGEWRSLYRSLVE